MMRSHLLATPDSCQAGIYYSIAGMGAQIAHVVRLDSIVMDTCQGGLRALVDASNI